MKTDIWLSVCAFLLLFSHFFLNYACAADMVYTCQKKDNQFECRYISILPIPDYPDDDDNYSLSFIEEKYLES